MANAIELITKYSTKAWDKVYKAESRSAILDGEKDLLKFVGAKTVRIAKPSVSGLSDYKRPNAPQDGVFGGDGHATDFAAGKGYGYQQGDLSVEWETFTINCDRGVQLRIELFDDEETDGIAVAYATTEVSRTQVIPEVDAYVFSKLVENAKTIKSVDITLGATLGVTGAGQPIFELNAGFLQLAEDEVPEEDQVIFCSNAFYNMLRNTPELVKALRQDEYTKDVKFTISEYEGRPLIAVPQNRFRTLIHLLQGGYGWDANSKNINFIIVNKKAVYHVVKYDKVRVFNPGVVQDFDGYKVNVRIYHDFFVPDRKKAAIYACVSNTVYNSAISSERTITYSFDAATNIISNVAIAPAGDLVRGLYASTSELAIGAAPASGALVMAGVDLTAAPISLGSGTYYLYGVDNGQIVAKAAETFTIA